MNRLVAIVAAYAMSACSSSRGDRGSDHSNPPPPAHGDAIGSNSTGGSSAQVAQMFTVELRTISKSPTCRGNQRIKVDAQGALFQQTNDADCTNGSPWTRSYPTQPSYRLTGEERDNLASLIQSSGVLDLPAVSTDPTKATSGGYREELEITIGQRHVVVAVENTKVDAFSRVRQALIDFASR